MKYMYVEGFKQKLADSLLISLLNTILLKWAKNRITKSKGSLIFNSSGFCQQPAIFTLGSFDYSA